MADDELQTAVTDAVTDEHDSRRDHDVASAADAATDEDEAASLSPPGSRPATPPPAPATDKPETPATATADANGESDAAPQESSTSSATATTTTAPASSNGSSSNGGVSINDLLLQLRAWKERSSRMEVLLAKKSARLQEMDETEAKLKRLLAMAKRSIDNSKQELAQKDAELAELRAQAAKRAGAQHSWRPDASTREPKRVLAKVAHGATTWCLVEYANESDLDDAQDFAWHSFASADELRAYAARASGEPIALPDFSLTPFESERARKELKEEIERVQEEFRRYRVRAEITRKQKEAEIRKLSASAAARQAEQIAETDVSSELQAARMQIRRLTKSQQETEERELEWRRKFEKLLKDYEKLSGTMGETVLATEWRERYEHVVREKEEAEKKVEELRALASAHGGGGDLQALRHEFAQYRKRALNAVEQKERELSDAQAQLLQDAPAGPPGSRSGSRGALGAVSSASLRRMSSESCSSLSGFEPPNATTTNEYLKNIVYKYMTSDQDEGKAHMETAIATVLNFTPAEVAAVQEKRKQTQCWFW